MLGEDHGALISGSLSLLVCDCGQQRAVVYCLHRSLLTQRQSVHIGPVCESEGRVLSESACMVHVQCVHVSLAECSGSASLTSLASCNPVLTMASHTPLI